MMSYLKSDPTNRAVYAPGAHFPERDGRKAGAKVGAPAGHGMAEIGTRSRRFPWLSALSPLLWPATAAAWNGKVVLVDRVTVERYGRTVAFVKIGDAVVDEEPIRQGLARVFTRYCDGASSEAGTVVYAKCHTAMGASEKLGDDGGHCASPPRPPHGLAASRFVDNVRQIRGEIFPLTGDLLVGEPFSRRVTSNVANAMWGEPHSTLDIVDLMVEPGRGRNASSTEHIPRESCSTCESSALAP